MADVNPMHDRIPNEIPRSSPRMHPTYEEGTFTRVVEHQTAKVPSAVFLVAALGAMGASAACTFLDKPRGSAFFGMWAPTLLIMGVYNKLVKSLGTS